MTQAALGSAVAGAVLGRRLGWRAFAWGAGLGTLPDLDLVLSYGGPVADFVFHRGASHALAERNLAHERVLATPAPFNTVLWRIVAMTGPGDDYYEGYYTLGSDRAPQMVRFPSRPELLEPLASTPAVERLRAFTDGFHAVGLQGDSVVITDLRMGAAPAYAFAFAVGQRREGAIVPMPDVAATPPRPPLDRVLGEIFACARGEPVALIAC